MDPMWEGIPFPPEDVSVVDESQTPSLLLELRGVLAHLLFLLPKPLHGPEHQQKHGVYLVEKIEEVGRNTDICDIKSACLIWHRYTMFLFKELINNSQIAVNIIHIYRIGISVWVDTWTLQGCKVRAIQFWWVFGELSGNNLHW